MEGHTATTPDSAAVHGPVRRYVREHAVLVVISAVVVLIALIALVKAIAGPNDFSLVDDASGDWAYLATFALIFGDAVCPVLPGETTLNAASTLASQGSLDLWLVMAAGALGAIAGDSTLYWIARSARGKVEHQLEAARGNAKLATALDFLGESAPVLLVAGRYVPGARFVINATMGISAYPYRRFIVWSALGGLIWSIYTCALAYLVATALVGFPLASVVISGLITTTAIAVIFIVLRRRRTEAAAAPAQ